MCAVDEEEADRGRVDGRVALDRVRPERCSLSCLDMRGSEPVQTGRFGQEGFTTCVVALSCSQESGRTEGVHNLCGRAHTGCAGERCPLSCQDRLRASLSCHDYCADRVWKQPASG